MNSSIDLPQVPERQLKMKQPYLVAGFFVIMLVLRVVYAFRFRFDSDEPQHLHVVWGWANGLLQYRDVFDNHGPIFHLLCVPLFRVLGERPDILILMRLAMIPLLGIALWCVYRIGVNLFSKNVGIWAAVFTGLYPEYFFTATEFRTDNLWTVVWLFSLVIATGETLSAKRSFLIGFLLGIAFGVTVKSGLMVGAVSFGAISIIGRQWAIGRPVNWRQVCAFACAGLLGLLIVPASLAAFFAAKGALREFLYCNIFHNLVPHAQNWRHFDAHVLWFPIFALLTLVAFIRLGNRSMEPRWVRIVFLVLVAGSYFTALKTFFPTLTRQDDLPFIPLLVLLITAIIARLADRLPLMARLHVTFPVIAPIIAVAEISFILANVSIRENRTKEDTDMVADVLRATQPSDYVMDGIGETIFRRRPYYFVTEAFTGVRIEQGSIKDNIVERMIETRTALVRPKGLTETSREFIRRNYVVIGHDLFMLGKILKRASDDNHGDPITFEVVIPGRYSVVGDQAKTVSGALDGTPIRGPRLLEPGKHVIRLDPEVNGKVALFFTAGLEKNFSPFAKN